MLRTKILQWMKLAALGAALSLAMGSVAWGDDRDYYSRGEARDQGYHNGYRDGSAKGAYDREHGRRFKFKNDDWEDAHGYEHWMGSHGEYKSAYRHGYEEGYRRSYGDYGYRDRDYRGRDRDWR